MSRILTLLVGIAFLFLAVLGLLPGTTEGSRLFGLFSATFFNQIFYFILGLIALLCWMKGGVAPKRFLLLTGTFLALLGALGIYAGEGQLLYFLTVTTADNILHIVIGMILLYLALIFYKK